MAAVAVAPEAHRAHHLAPRAAARLAPAVPNSRFSEETKIMCNPWSF